MAKKATRSGAKATTSHTQVRVPRESAKADQATRGMLVAIELGGEWPNVAFEGHPRRVLVQLEGEAPLEFAERVTGGLAALFERGVELHTVALACNERLDAAADEARRSLLGLSLGSMAQRRRGEVLLSAATGSSPRLRDYLEALAADTRGEWQSAGLEVSVDRSRAVDPIEPTPHARVA